MKEGLIRVGDFGPRVPKAVQDEVLARQKDIAAGKLHPFRAVADVRDNQGNVVIAKGRVGASGTAEALREVGGSSNLEDAFVKIIGSDEGLMA